MCKLYIHKSEDWNVTLCSKSTQKGIGTSVNRISALLESSFDGFCFRFRFFCYFGKRHFILSLPTTEKLPEFHLTLQLCHRQQQGHSHTHFLVALPMQSECVEFVNVFA